MDKKIIKALEKEIENTIRDTRDEDGSPTSETDEGFIQGLEHAVEIARKYQTENMTEDHRFNAFYAHYPIKKSKSPARKAFMKLNPDTELYQKIMDAVTAQKASRQWQQKQYIPHPSTWLNQERWEDEVETVDGLPTDNKYAGL